MSMFMSTGPYYEAQKNRTKTLIQFQPLKVKDVVTDGSSYFRVEEFIQFEGKRLVLVSCIDSEDTDLVGRVGYRSMHFMLSKCWKSYTS